MVVSCCNHSISVCQLHFSGVIRPLELWLGLLMNLQEAANSSGLLWAGIRLVFSLGTTMLIFADLYVCSGSLRFNLLCLCGSQKEDWRILPHRFGDKFEVYLADWTKLFLLSPFRWNVVGFQGSLMSYFTEPIYFSSIILGSLYHADHLSRAMYQRITEIEDLPQSFSLNRPLLSGEKQTALLQMTDFHSSVTCFPLWQYRCDIFKYTRASAGPSEVWKAGFSSWLLWNIRKEWGLYSSRDSHVISVGFWFFFSVHCIQ